MSEAVSDTGPVLHLWEIDRLQALDVFDRLLLPALVAEELSKYGVELGAQALGAAVEIIRVEERERQQVLSEPGGSVIHAPDAEVVVVARRGGERLSVLTDDLALRQRLEAEGIDVSGSFGVLVRAFKKGLIGRPDLESATEALFFGRRCGGGLLDEDGRNIKMTQ